jgi:hypothetical protein
LDPVADLVNIHAAGCADANFFWFYLPATIKAQKPTNATQTNTDYIFFEFP